MRKRILVVTAGIIEKNGRFLIVQRSSGGHLAYQWEFPGGEVRFGETPEFCLRREIREELGIRIKGDELFGVSSHVYDRIGHVILLAYHCKFISGEIGKGINYAWVTPAEMSRYNFCEADIPLVRKLQGRSRK